MAEHTPTEKEVEQLAMLEGHDADIPSNIGSLPTAQRVPDVPKQQRDTNTTNSFDKDIEKEADGISSPRSSHEGIPGESKEPVELATEDEDPNIVFWDGPDDPENPLNWTKKKKWAAILVVSAITFLSPLGSSSFAPGVPTLMQEFGSSSDLLSGFVVSVYVLGFATGPLILAPLSEMYGRLPIYHSCTALFCIFNIACAVAPSLDSLIVFRFFAGCFGAAPLALGGGTIADIAEPEMRATAMSLWVLGPTVGPVIGPVAGGFICAYIGWRWDFWIIAITTGVIIVLSVFLLRETYAPAILARKTRRLRKETGNMELRSKLDNGMTTRELFLYSIVRPTKMLFLSPICFCQSAIVAVVYAFLYIMFTTVSEVFETQYGFSEAVSGLAYLGIGIGSFGGQFIYTWFENRNYRYHKEKGDLKPEHRLISQMPGVIFLPIGLFIYGWTVEANVHWIAPLIGSLLFGFGLLVIFMAASNYLVDVFTRHAASAMAANTVLRSLVACVLPLAGPKMYAALGYGWGVSVLGFVAVALIPIPFLFYRYGEWLRTDPRFQVKL